MQPTTPGVVACSTIASSGNPVTLGSYDLRKFCQALSPDLTGDR